LARFCKKLAKFKLLHTFSGGYRLWFGVGARRLRRRFGSFNAHWRCRMPTLDIAGRWKKSRLSFIGVKLKYICEHTCPSVQKSPSWSEKLKA
jgi:hypothetical protein